MAFLRTSEICHNKEIFSPLEIHLFNLNNSKLEQFFRPSGVYILLSVFASVDGCLVWMVYLIHGSNQTSRWSFSFNPKDPYGSIMKFYKELNLIQESFKTMKDWCGNPVFRGFFFVFNIMLILTFFRHKIVVKSRLSCSFSIWWIMVMSFCKLFCLYAMSNQWLSKERYSWNYFAKWE